MEDYPNTSKDYHDYIATVGSWSDCIHDRVVAEMDTFQERIYCLDCKSYIQ